MRTRVFLANAAAAASTQTTSIWGGFYRFQSVRMSWVSCGPVLPQLSHVWIKLSIGSGHGRQSLGDSTVS